ncbi:MAG: CZB domain-containing protein [Anaerolineales bacterium]|nr:CZB domain-containing protein [Anaerolineales bacterium]
MNLSTRILLPVITALFLSVGALTGYSVWSQYELIDAQEQERLNALADVFADQLHQESRMAVTLAASIAADPDIQQAFAERDRERLLALMEPIYATLHERYGVSQAHFHIAPGVSFLRVHKPEAFGDDISTTRLMAVKALSEQTVVTGLEQGKGGYGLRGIVPVTHNGIFIGTFEIGFDFSAALLDEFKASQGSDVSVYLFDPAGETPFTLLASTLETPADISTAIRQQVIDEGAPQTAQVDLGQEPHRILSHLLTDFSGHPVGVFEVDLSRAEAIQTIQNSQYLSLGLGVALLLLAGIVIWQILSRVIIRPLMQLTNIAMRLAEGDTQVRVAETRRPDEIGKLTRALAQTTLFLIDSANTATTVAAGDLTTVVQPRSQADTLGQALARMVVDLRGALNQVSEAADEVQQASQHLVDNTARVGDASRQIAATVEQVSAGARQQADGVTRTANSMNQMKSAIEGVAQGAQEQASAMTQASAIAQQINAAIEQVTASTTAVDRDSASAASAARAGVDVVSETLAGMNTIKVKVNVSAAKVREMGQRSDEIGAIVELIDDISSQTNLLALNAAIEAARAGEHGRGFAVVADEVRKLAERSSGATKEIGGLVRAIQTSVKDAVSAMDDGSREVEIGAQRAQAAGQALNEIVTAAEAVQSQVTTTLQATTSMSSASHQLTESMDSVSAVVEENTAATEQMAAGSIEVADALRAVAAVGQENGAAVSDVAQAASAIAGQVESVAAASTQLAQLADRMKQVVHQFKLSEADEAEVHETFVTFKRAHLAWVERARSWIAGTEPVAAEISDHTTCALGRWRAGRSAHEHGHLPEFQAVEEPHRRFHSQLTRLASTIGAGRVAEASTEVEALARTSQEIVIALERLEAATGH